MLYLLVCPDLGVVGQFSVEFWFLFFYRGNVATRDVYGALLDTRLFGGKGVLLRAPRGA